MLFPNRSRGVYKAVTHEQPSDTCQFDYTSLVEMTTADSRRLLRFRRIIWAVRRRWWYLSVLGVREFNRKILPSTTLGKFIFGGRESSDNSRNVAVNSTKLAYENPDSSQPVPEFQPSREIHESLNLKAGDWIEVKSAKEIFVTLDERGKHRGLTFSQEMMKFCGKRFKVFRVLDKICMESTGELRRMKTPSVMLEGVICDGSFHGGCTRSCFHFWREEWLQRSHPPADSKSENA
jgi:hypothetical protein